MDTTKMAGEVQVVELTRTASTVTTINTNVSAKKNPDGSVDLTMSTADGRTLNGNLGAEVVAYQCADGFSFNTMTYPYQPAGGVFPRFNNESSATVNISAPTFNDKHARCDVQGFQIAADSMHADYVIAGTISFTV
jgi:hypothetical protein